MGPLARGKAAVYENAAFRLDTFLWVGANGIVIQIDKDSDAKYIGYGSKDCVEDYCDRCEEAGSDVITLLVFAVLFTLPTLYMDLVRTTQRGDLNCARFSVITLSLFSMMFQWLAISYFYYCCLDYIPDRDPLWWGRGYR